MRETDDFEAESVSVLGTDKATLSQDFEAESVNVLGTDKATLSQDFASRVSKCPGDGK